MTIKFLSAGEKGSKHEINSLPSSELHNFTAAYDGEDARKMRRVLAYMIESKGTFFLDKFKFGSLLPLEFQMHTHSFLFGVAEMSLVRSLLSSYHCIHSIEDIESLSNSIYCFKRLSSLPSYISLITVNNGDSNNTRTPEEFANKSISNRGKTAARTIFSLILKPEIEKNYSKCLHAWVKK